MEFVIVTYPPAQRSVFIDGVLTGSTDEVLQMDAGTHVFDLGDPADYDPESRKVVVEGTSILVPMRLAFTRKGG